VICFTDPALIGHINRFFTLRGDVDDVACIIFLAQHYKDKITFCICDDENEQRYNHFMEFIGYDLEKTYGCSFVPEHLIVEKPLPESTVLHIHAPVKDYVASWIDAQKENIEHVFTQGESSQRANFKPAPEMWELISTEPLKSKTTLHSSDETNFVISSAYDYTRLSTEKCKLVMQDYTGFSFRKAFGLAIGNTFLADMLYSDTGFNGGIGNGIRRFLPLMNKLQESRKMPQTDEIFTHERYKKFVNIARKQYKGDNRTVIPNLSKLLWLMDQYTDLNHLLVDVGGEYEIPNMGNLGVIRKRESHPDQELFTEVSQMFEPTVSTPMFDFAAAKMAIEGKPSSVKGGVLAASPLIVADYGKSLIESLELFDKDLSMGIRHEESDLKKKRGGRKNRKSKGSRPKRKSKTFHSIRRHKRQITRRHKNRRHRTRREHPPPRGGH
jgi:hypothetical protein